MSWTDLFRRFPLFVSVGDSSEAPELAPPELGEDHRAIARLASRLSWVDFEPNSNEPTRRALLDLIAVGRLLGANPELMVFVRGRYPEQQGSDIGRLVALQRGHVIERLLLRNGASSHQVRTHSLPLPPDPLERVVEAQFGRAVFRIRRRVPRSRAA